VFKEIIAMNANQKLKSAVDALTNGRVDEAEALYRQVLHADPQDTVALHHLGIIHIRRREFDVAIQSIRQSLAINENNPEAYSNLGLAFMGKREFDEAIEALRHSTRLNPNNPDSYNNLATALLERQMLDEAIQSCQAALKLNSGFFLAHYNLGVVLQRQAKLDEAIAAFSEAIRIRPNFPEAYCNLGLALVDQGKLDEGIMAYRRAIELRPNFPEAYNNLGQPLSDQRKFDESANAYRQALNYRPHYAEASANLVTVLRKQSKFEEAIIACKQALAINPHNTKAEIELTSLNRLICDWSHFDVETQRLQSLIQEVEPFIYMNVPSTPGQQLICATSWASKMLSDKPFVHDFHRSSDRIRIGYLSADFRRHATAYLMAELFERHDRSRFEIFGYSYGFDDESDMRQRLVNAFDHFSDFNKTPHVESSQRIYNDKIDILIDLKGYTGETRTGILVNRPAPIQVNYMGYPGTMGANFIDYIIADAFVIPKESQPFYTEKVVNLPHCYQPNDTKRQIAPRAPTRSEYGLPDRAFVFCCFNGSYKISPTFFGIWMRILKAVPGSVLWLLSVDSSMVGNLRSEASARGVASDRLIFGDGMPLPEHLARHRLADLFLDTFPINAHTTASDALWAGLPVLTCSGSTFASRVAGSLLRAVGLPELMTTTTEEYESKAIEYASNPRKMAGVKEKLARNLGTTPLFDIDRYTRGLESAYTRMHEIWRAGEQPRAFDVNESWSDKMSLLLRRTFLR
jgi:protein O-GlcNAc transferase